jgi:hypothetical protein
MNFEDFSNVVRFEGLNLETHDFYLAGFSQSMDQQGFLDYAYQQIPNLQGIWFKAVGNVVYFVVAKDTVIPEDFAGSLDRVEAAAEGEGE